MVHSLLLRVGPRARRWDATSRVFGFKAGRIASHPCRWGRGGDGPLWGL